MYLNLLERGGEGRHRTHIYTTSYIHVYIYICIRYLHIICICVISTYLCICKYIWPYRSQTPRAPPQTQTAPMTLSWSEQDGGPPVKKYIYIYAVWIPPEARLELSVPSSWSWIPVSPAVGTCTYEPPKVQPHFLCWYRPSHVHSPGSKRQLPCALTHRDTQAFSYLDLSFRRPTHPKAPRTHHLLASLAWSSLALTHPLTLAPVADTTDSIPHAHRTENPSPKKELQRSLIKQSRSRWSGTRRSLTTYWLASYLHAISPFYPLTLLFPTFVPPQIP